MLGEAHLRRGRPSTYSPNGEDGTRTNGNNVHKYMDECIRVPEDQKVPFKNIILPECGS